MSLQSKEDLIAELQRKEFRDAFASARVSHTLALQIRTMREARGWTQKQLADMLGTSQNAVYRLESPRYGKATVTTLTRLASIFDVGLAVWFVPFSKLVDRVTKLVTEDILVPSFDDDPGFQESIAASAQVQTTIAMANNPLLPKAVQPNTFYPETKINPKSPVKFTYDRTVPPQSHLNLQRGENEPRRGPSISGAFG